jgi:hypothetical protein
VLYGREPNWRNGGTEKAEDVKLRGAGISPKQCPRNARRKKAGLLNREGRYGIGRAMWAGKAEQKKPAAS